MDFRPWPLLIGQMIAAGGPRRMSARISWPMHAALKELHGDAGRQGRLAHGGVLDRFAPRGPPRAAVVRLEAELSSVAAGLKDAARHPVGRALVDRPFRGPGADPRPE